MSANNRTSDRFSKTPEKPRPDVSASVVSSNLLRSSGGLMQGNSPFGATKSVVDQRITSRTKSELFASKLNSADKKTDGRGYGRSETHFDAGTKCNVCLRIFNQLKGIVQQHCQFCGKSVCKECSTNKIEETRVCDMCHFKALNKRAAERRNQILKSKEEAIKRAKVNIDRMKKEIQELEAKCQESSSDNPKNVHNLTTMESELTKTEEALSKKKETLLRIKQNLNDEKELVEDHEKEYEKYLLSLNRIKFEVQQKRTTHLQKLEEYNRLNYQKMRYEQSPSFLEYMQNGPEVSHLQSVGGSLMVKSYVSVYETWNETSHTAGGHRETFGPATPGDVSVSKIVSLPVKSNHRINSDSIIVERKAESCCNEPKCTIF